MRAPFARPGRTLGLTLQAAAAVATVLVVASLGTSLAQFAEHELEPWRYEEVARPVNPGDGWQTSRGDDQLGAANGEEAGLFAQGSFGDFDIDVYGTLATTEVIDRTVVEGRWFRSGAATPEAVVTDGFARHRGIGVGDAVELELPSGPAEVVVVGTHRLRSAAFFVERAALGDMLGRSDTADVLWVMGRPGPMSEFVSSSHMVEVERPADLVEEDRAARSMIMGIFWAIGIVVATVAAIGFASSLQMMVHDRRRELAAVRAGGASSGLLRRLVLSEAMWVAVVGAALGAVAAHFGASALMAFVESGESMDIGYAYATHMLAPVVAAALAGVALLSVLAVRPVVRCGAGILLR